MNGTVRLLRITLALVYCYVQAVGVIAAESNFWMERREYLESKKKEKSDSLKLASLPLSISQTKILETSFQPPVYSQGYSSSLSLRTIPSVDKERFPFLLDLLAPYGSICEVIPANLNSSRIVIHIQDAHMNFEAQKNISKAVKALIDKNVIDMVGLEGVEGSIDIENLRTFPDSQAVETVAEYLLKENKISGPIYAALTSSKSVPPFIGMEESALYTNHVETYKQAVPFIKEYQEKTEKLQRNLERNKQTYFNRKLLEVAAKIEDYRQGNIELGDENPKGSVPRACPWENV